MRKFIARRMLRAFSKRYHYDTSYIEMVLKESPGAFFKFAPVMKASDHREVRAAAAIGQKGRYVSVAKTVADLTEDRNQTNKPNDFWSEWQDLNLRPLRPERSALPG